MSLSSILIASGNKGKLAEFAQIAAKFGGIKLFPPSELKNLDQLEPQVDESGTTYPENAKLKADAYFSWSKIPSLADDTGLEVDALNGAPGVYSARFSGEPSDPKKNIEKLLSLLDKKNNRRAKFVCVLALRISESEIIFERAELIGKISMTASGRGGFGYDSVFIPAGEACSLAELKEGGYEKTHRMLAAKSLFQRLCPVP